MRRLCWTFACLLVAAAHWGCGLSEDDDSEPVVVVDRDAVTGDDAGFGEDGESNTGESDDTDSSPDAGRGDVTRDGGLPDDDGNGSDCQSGRSLCDGQCVDLESTDAHCGACGNTCPGEASCSSGTCQCPDGTSLCDGSCVDTSSSGDHCGSCGNSCGDGVVCEGGSCQCPEGRTSCGDGCVDTTVDNTHCGGCDSPCENGRICTSGVCRDDTKPNRVIRQTNIVRSTPTDCHSGRKPAAPPVHHNQHLREAATKHARDMAENGFFSHTGSDGSSPRERVANTAYSGQYRAENIAGGNADAETTVQQWVDSKTGHCKGLMLSDVDELGAGYVEEPSSQYTHYWVQNFGRE